MSYKIADNAVTTQTETGYIILNLATQGFYTLNEVGGLVWEGIGSDQSLEDMVKKVVEVYDVEPDVAMGDIKSLIESMLESKLIISTRSGNV